MVAILRGFDATSAKLLWPFFCTDLSRLLTRKVVPRRIVIACWAGKSRFDIRRAAYNDVISAILSRKCHVVV